MAGLSIKKFDWRIPLIITLGFWFLLILDMAREGRIRPEPVLLLGFGFFSFLYVTRSVPHAAAVTLLLGLPVIFFYAAFSQPPVAFLLMTGLAAAAAVLALFFAPGKAASVNSPESLREWRFIIRPSAGLFIGIYFLMGRPETLVLIGIVAFIFVMMDTIRLLSKRFNQIFFHRNHRFYRKTEQRHISSMTCFLLSGFFCMLLYPAPAAVTAFGFMILGDFFSKYFGVRYGKKPLFGKTVEGSLAHLNACLFFGAVTARCFFLPWWGYIGAAVAASMFEILPWKIDDNLSVALGSGAVMTLLLRIFPV